MVRLHGEPVRKGALLAEDLREPGPDGVDPPLPLGDRSRGAGGAGDGARDGDERHGVVVDVGEDESGDA